MKQSFKFFKFKKSSPLTSPFASPARLVHGLTRKTLLHRVRGAGPAVLLSAAMTMPVLVKGQAKDTAKSADSVSPWGLDYYAQGGVVVDGVAYFAASDGSRRKGVTRTDDGFAHVVAFDMETFRKIRAYDFGPTYDSTPLVFRKKDGSWLVIAHEHKKNRTVARDRDSGEVAWIGAENQPGHLFFGYSYYQRDDGSKLLLMACRNGLHAMSGETGEDVWWVERRSMGGVTPSVDQRRGVIYYQCDGKILKINAGDGAVLKEVEVPEPHRCVSWNTVLVDDEHGYHVVTRWYGKPKWDSAIRVYDGDLNLRWERSGLADGKKNTITYVAGKVITGSGDVWGEANYAGNDDWKYIAAYSIREGKVIWKCDLSDYEYRGMANLPYFDGYLYGEGIGSPPSITSSLFRIDATTGELAEVYDYGRPISSCATHIIAQGKILSGDLWNDSTVVTRIGEGSMAEWPGPYGDPQTNQMRVPDEAGTEIVPIAEIGPGREQRFEDRPDLVKSAKVVAKSLVHFAGTDRIPKEQARVEGMIDGDSKAWWDTTSRADLAIHPIDLVVEFGAESVLDTIVIETGELEERRLRDFDLYAGLGNTWDGERPLARVRNNKDEKITLRFDAVRADRLFLRVLGSNLPDNSRARVAELSAYAAAGPPKRQLESSPIPPSPFDAAGHDRGALRAAIAATEPGAKESALARARVDALKARLELVEESQPYRRRLERISAETEDYGKLGAPEWALAQRDAMARLRNWACYWIDKQQADGQFGGGWGDDVELVCGWPVLVLGQDDTRVRDSLERLAEGVWKSAPFLDEFGYDRLSDVEHAAEPIVYSQPNMVVSDYGDPKWAERCRRTVATMEKHFLSRNENKHLQFRSDHFGFDPRTLRPVTKEKQRPFDIPEGSKALKTALYAVWATGDEMSRNVMLDYGRTWMKAAADAEGAGRIEGMMPAQIRWPSGLAVGTHTHVPSMRATLFHLIGCFHASGDERYLEPVRSVLEHCVFERSVKGVPSASHAKTEQGDWTARLEHLALVAVLYRQASGDTRFDEAFSRWAGRIRDSLVDGVKSYVLLDRRSEGLWHVDRPLPVGAYLESRTAVGAQLYLGWEVTGEEDYLAKLGWNLSSCLNDKWGAFTHWFYDRSEWRVTSNDHLAHKLQSSESALALMYLGGPATIEAVWPRFDVTWKQTGENFCALVREGGSGGFRAQLYCFDEMPRAVTGDFWELAPGTYEVATGPDADRDGRPDVVDWNGTLEVQARRSPRRPVSLTFTLPARRLMAVEIQRRSEPREVESPVPEKSIPENEE